MEIERANFTAFAVTIRFNAKKDAEEKDYVPMIENMIRKGIEIHSLYYEEDKGKTYNGIHVHGIIYVKKNFYRKKLAMDGFSIKMEEIYSWDGWQKYLNKGYIKKVQYGQIDHVPTDEDLIDLASFQQAVMDDIEDNCCPPVNIFKLMRNRAK